MTTKVATKTSFYATWAKADAAGKAAAEKAKPTPMIVGEAKGLFSNEIDETKPTYYVAGGVCGFAWVWFKGNTAFGRWAKAEGFARKAYGGGLQYTVFTYGQSMQTKAAYASAFARVLQAEGIQAYADYRMD